MYGKEKILAASDKFQRVENPIRSIITTKTIRRLPILYRQVLVSLKHSS